MSKAEEKALKAYPELFSGSIFGPLPVDLNKASREKYQEGYEQAEKDIIFLIESRISEILGDAQPSSVLRMELQGIIDKIKIVFNV